MTIIRTVLFFFFTVIAAPAMACVEVLPDHPQIVAVAEAIYEATVQSSSTDQVLMVKITKTRKGKAIQTVSVPKSECSVPPFPTGSRVIVIRLNSRRYEVVLNRAPTSSTRDGR